MDEPGANTATLSRRRFRALVADDDDIVTRYLSASLRSAGWAVITAKNGIEALDVYEKEHPDIVILDLMMPKLNGFEACRILRERSQVPIIVLSVRNDPSDKVRALGLGADDYLSKPFAIEELKARMTSVLRRARAGVEAPKDSRRVLGDLTLDSASHVVRHAGLSARLTPTEHALLDEFIENAGKVLTHSYLLSRVWGPCHGYDKAYVHVFVNRLRRKIEADPHNPRLILTVQGVGYVFRPSDEDIAPPRTDAEVPDRGQTP